jgi:hypothetical protein
MFYFSRPLLSFWECFLCFLLSEQLLLPILPDFLTKNEFLVQDVVLTYISSAALASITGECAPAWISRPS